MTMESRAREIQRIVGETGSASGRDARDVVVEAGVAVHQKNCVAEREGSGKSGKNHPTC
jgi:hypothetical protein